MNVCCSHLIITATTRAEIHQYESLMPVTVIMLILTVLSLKSMPLQTKLIQFFAVHKLLSTFMKDLFLDVTSSMYFINMGSCTTISFELLRLKK